MTLLPGGRVWILLILFLSSGVSVSMAHAVESISDQRQSLAVQRDNALRYFDAKDTQCQRQFAVTGCLNDVNRERLARLSAIKKADNQLKDRERLERAIEQRQQLVDRADTRQKGANEVLSAPLGDGLIPPTSGNESVSNPASSRQSNSGEVAKEPKVNITAARQRENRAGYEAKQLEAKKNRENRDRRVRERKPAASGLPTTP